LFLSCSLIFVLGHSILPHSHLDNEYHLFSFNKKQSHTLTDIIKLTLSHDLGANHLEEYNDCKPLELISTDFQGLLHKTESNEFLADYILPINENTETTNSDLVPKYFCANTGLRAPPSKY
jgi:hypothetical protein